MRYGPWHPIARVALFVIMVLVLWPRVAYAQSNILLDGQFEDWVGQAHLEDPSGDTKHYWDDVRYWYWATNQGVSSMFFMAERYPQHGQHNENQGAGELDRGTMEGLLSRLTRGGSPGESGVGFDPEALSELEGIEGNGTSSKQIHYTIFIDTDNNGQFEDPQDAVVYADYFPSCQGLVLVSVFRAHSNWFNFGFWGDTADEGSLRCEWPVPFSHLGIEPGQTIRMVLFAQDKRTDYGHPEPMANYEYLVSRREADRVPDTGDLQWAPVPTLGDFGLALLVGVSAVIPAVLRRRGRGSG